MPGLHFDSLADLPVGMREKAAAQLIKQIPKAKQEDGPALDEKESKYHNVKTTVAGIKFDSRKEARRYEILQKAQDMGIIRGLRLQEDFTLQEAYTTAEGKRIRAIRYAADFTYYVCASAPTVIQDNRQAYLWFDLQDVDFWCKHAMDPNKIIEDAKSKGTKTKVYIIKKKLMADRGFEIREL